MSELVTIQMNYSAFTKEAWQHYSTNVTAIHHQLETAKSGLGWLHYPLENHAPLFQQIKQVVNEIKLSADVLVVIGIGGSYLGAKAIQTALSPYFEQAPCSVVYIGQNMSGAYIEQLLRSLDGKSVYVNVISKSGTTFESAIAFRLVRHYMEQQYGEDTARRMIVTTDAEEGLLKEFAGLKGYRQFTIPADIGGRYSVFTPVGLLPLAVVGVDIYELMRGAVEAAVKLKEPCLEYNAAYRYAVARHLLYKQGYRLELLATFEPSLTYVQQWWTQLFAESEGKGQQGLYPCSVQFPSDLHSVGQFIQQGSPILFETVLHIKEASTDFIVPFDRQNADKLNYVAGKSMQELTTIAKDGVIAAHKEANVPIIELQIAKLDAYHLGYMLYFFMKACAMSATLLQVNPFDQPGVEAYKQKIQELLRENVNQATLFS